MANEDAKKMLKAKLECLKRETSGTDIDCNCKNCDECNLCYEQGNMGEQKEALELAIKALEQESILDKIRAKIEKLQKMCDTNDLNLLSQHSAFGMALDVIDEYRTESEEV